MCYFHQPLGSVEMEALREEYKVIGIASMAISMLFLGIFVGDASKEATMRVADAHMAKLETTEGYILGACAYAGKTPTTCNGTIKAPGREFRIVKGILFERHTFTQQEHPALMLPDVCTGFESEVFLLQEKVPDYKTQECSITIYE